MSILTERFGHTIFALKRFAERLPAHNRPEKSGSGDRREMGDQTTLERTVPATGEDESAKRRQIIDGASKVFLAQGFDAASMNAIARAAGVSKGTLYVYFGNKEELFEAIVEQECDVQAEGIFDLDPNDHDVAAVLTRLGVAYVKFLCRPEKASAIRTVIAIADRMPEIGRKFYEAGPAVGLVEVDGGGSTRSCRHLKRIDDGVRGRGRRAARRRRAGGARRIATAGAAAPVD